MTPIARYSPDSTSWWRRDIAITAAFALVLYSLILYGLVWGFGFHRPPVIEVEGYQTYFEAVNWWPYPVFFLLMTPALWLSWNPFLHVWRKLAQTGVLRAQTGKLDPEVLDDLEAYLRSKRWVAFLLAIVVTAFINTMDIREFLKAYTGSTYRDQVEVACQHPRFFFKWIFDGWTDRHLEGLPCTDPAGDTAPISADEPPEPIPGPQMLVAASGYFQQVAIVMLATLAFFQLLLHTTAFALFDRLRFPRERGLRLRLDPESSVNEFGLEHWNHALNNLYWAVTPALIAPFVSRASVVDLALMAPGQRLMNIFIPLAVLAPMIATIISRQSKLPAVWERLQPHGSADPQKYLNQRLWPLDRNWASKLGIILAFAASGLVLGIEISDLIRL